MCVFVWVLSVGRRSSTADVRCQKYCALRIRVRGAGVMMSRELLACMDTPKGVSSLLVFALKTTAWFEATIGLRPKKKRICTIR